MASIFVGGAAGIKVVTATGKNVVGKFTSSNGGAYDVPDATNTTLPDNGVDYNTISTALNGQRTEPANLQEQSLWNGVVDNPTAGRHIANANNDPRFRPEDGFQKMEMTTVSDTGQRTTIHYQYNSNTGEAYDIKIDYPRQQFEISL